MLNYELNEYYGYNWDYEDIDNAKEKIERYYNRTLNIINKYKTKKATINQGCFNHYLVDVELNNNYELIFYSDSEGKGLNRNIFTKIDLKDVIFKNESFKYDRKYHVLSIFVK